jgi:hypothetical protein
MLVGVSDCLPRSRAYKNTSPWTINPTSNAGGATPASPTAILPCTPINVASVSGESPAGVQPSSGRIVRSGAPSERKTGPGEETRKQTHYMPGGKPASKSMNPA